MRRNLSRRLGLQIALKADSSSLGLTMKVRVGGSSPTSPFKMNGRSNVTLGFLVRISLLTRRHQMRDVAQIRLASRLAAAIASAALE